jgi:pyruvate/2-oxoglutarate dehydrogenase complex dihydrolipoamide dehydrogenase (E3) component
VPPRLLILGGGIVGVEMAQAWAWYGASVTIVEVVDRLISREEPLASDAVREALERAGVVVELEAKVVAARLTEQAGPRFRCPCWRTSSRRSRPEASSG